MSSLTEASTSNALRPNLDNSLTSRIPMRFALQYSIASHNTGRSSFFFAPEMYSSKTLQTSIPLYFAYSDKSLTCLPVLCLSPILETRAYITPVFIYIKDLIEHRFTSVQLSVQDFFEHKLNLNTNHQPKKPLTRLTASTFVFITTSA